MGPVLGTPPLASGLGWITLFAISGGGTVRVGMGAAPVAAAAVVAVVVVVVVVVKVCGAVFCVIGTAWFIVPSTRNDAAEKWWFVFIGTAPGAVVGMEGC